MSHRKKAGQHHRIAKQHLLPSRAKILPSNGNNLIVQVQGDRSFKAINRVRCQKWRVVYGST